MGFAEGFEKGWTMVETMRANKHKREMDEADLALKKQQEEREARAANQQYEFNQQNNPALLAYNQAGAGLRTQEYHKGLREQTEASLKGPADAADAAQERETKRLQLFTGQYAAVKAQHEDAVKQLKEAQYRIDMAAAGGTDPDPGDIAMRDSWQGQVSKYQGQLAAMGDPTKAAAGFRIADAMANPEIQAALLSDRDVNKFIQSNTPAGQVFVPTSVYAVGSNLVVRGNTIDGKTGEVIAQDGYLSNAAGTPVTVPVDVIEPLINRYRQDTEDASTPAQIPGPDGKPATVKGVTKSTMASAMQYAPTVLQEAEKAYNKPEFANLKKLMTLEQFQRLALAVPFVESSWKPKSVSPRDAVGLYQLMPDTARQPGRNVTPVADLSTLADPRVNIRIGVEYLGGTINHFNSVEKGIYYYGPQKNDPLYPQKIAETLRSGAPDALMGKGAGRSLGDGYEAVTAALNGGQPAAAPAAPVAGQPAVPAPAAGQPDPAWDPAAPADSAAGARGGIPPGLGAAATAVVTPSAGQPAASAAGQPPAPDVPRGTSIQESANQQTALGKVADWMAGGVKAVGSWNAGLTMKGVANDLDSTYFGQPWFPGSTATWMRESPRENEAQKYFMFRDAIIERGLLPKDKIAKLDSFFQPFAPKGFTPMQEDAGPAQTADVLSRTPKLPVPETPEEPAPATPGLPSAANTALRAKAILGNYGFTTIEQARVAANAPDGVGNENQQKNGKAALDALAKLSKTTQDYDAASGTLITKDGDGNILSLQTIENPTGGNSDKAEKLRVDLITDLAKAFIPTIKDKNGKVLNPEEQSEFISQAVMLTNQVPGTRIDSKSMPSLIAMFKLQKKIEAEYEDVKFTSLAPAYNLMKAGGKYMKDEDTITTVLLKAQGMAAQDKNLTLEQAVSIITADAHPITGHLIKNGMPTGQAIEVTHAVEAAVAKHRKQVPKDTRSDATIAAELFNRMLDERKSPTKETAK